MRLANPQPEKRSQESGDSADAQESGDDLRRESRIQNPRIQNSEVEDLRPPWERWALARPVVLSASEVGQIAPSVVPERTMEGTPQASVRRRSTYPTSIDLRRRFLMGVPPTGNGGPFAPTSEIEQNYAN